MANLQGMLSMIAINPATSNGIIAGTKIGDYITKPSFTIEFKEDLTQFDSIYVAAEDLINMCFVEGRKVKQCVQAEKPSSWTIEGIKDDIYIISTTTAPKVKFALYIPEK